VFVAAGWCGTTRPGGAAPPGRCQHWATWSLLRHGNGLVDVIVVGARPTGLMLACELALSGLTGLGIAYPGPGRQAHPWTGRRVPDLTCEGGQLYELLRDGRFLLVDGGDMAWSIVDPAGASGRVRRLGQQQRIRCGLKCGSCRRGVVSGPSRPNDVHRQRAIHLPVPPRAVPIPAQRECATRPRPGGLNDVHQT
jgi:hypothetical protein